MLFLLGAIIIFVSNADCEPSSEALLRVKPQGKEHSQNKAYDEVVQLTL
jgi:hypothetical protein